MPREIVQAAPIRRANRFRDLVKDRAGNVLPIVAMAFIPMLAIIGGGIDMSRGYMSRTRLQQACDAGVLAARKQLGSSAIVGTTVPKDPTATGNRFFNLNFQDGDYGTTDRKFSMTLEKDYTILGNASVNVPTAVMGLFGVEGIPVTVECTSQFNYSNTDIMMVLDTTGSMNEYVSGATKISTLRKVVKDFHATVERAKTDGIRVRYGFVPYATNVNVGYLLQSRWMADSWKYEGREADNSGNWVYQSLDVATPSWGSGNSANLYKGGVSQTSIKMAGTPKKPEHLNIAFDGCIEERQTYMIDDYNDIDLKKARDLDIDTPPDPKDPETQWKPWIRAIAWRRDNPLGQTTDKAVPTPKGHDLSCPTEARKLAEMTAGEVASYVDDLKIEGTTYHDIGMIWGGRLLSPTGLFAADNAAVKGRPTMRHLIFLTDGGTNAQQETYGAYGLEGLSQRRWKPGFKYSMNQTVEKRFNFVCNQVKNRNITVWVIGFGTSVTPMLKSCAGDGHWFQADSASALAEAFATIASAIGDLRITK